MWNCGVAHFMVCGIVELLEAPLVVEGPEIYLHWHELLCLLNISAELLRNDKFS